jgi:hypothetical protein
VGKLTSSDTCAAAHRSFDRVEMAMLKSAKTA